MTPRTPWPDHLSTMHSAVEISDLRPGLFIWQTYDETVKADLFSTGIERSGELYLVDPIAPDDASLAARLSKSAVNGVIVTNANHARAAAEFSRKFSAPVFLHSAARDAIDASGVMEIGAGAETVTGLTVIAIDGAPPGEIALHCDADGGTMIVGDALINFGSHGFTFLPAKYCANARRMRKSLAQLLDYRFERMLFAHGTPIMSHGRDRLADLLES